MALGFLLAAGCADDGPWQSGTRWRGAGGGPEDPGVGVRAVTGVDNGFGGDEIRQGASVALTITGTDLAGATSVMVGTMATTIDSRAATELRASFYVDHGYAIGAVALTVVTPMGTTTVPGALEVTPFVVSPTGTIGGRGTYESPMHLCDSALGAFGDGPGWGDTVQLLGGVHQCGAYVLFNEGILVEGAADGSTVIEGAGGTGFVFSFYPSPTQVTAIRRITFAPPLEEYSVRFAGNSLTLEEVAGGRVEVTNANTLIVTDYQFQGGGLALDLAARELTLADVLVRCDAGDHDGIRLSPSLDPVLYGIGTVERVRVEHCRVGLRIGKTANLDEMPKLEIEELELIDNEVGMIESCGEITMHDPVISGDAMTARPSEVGIVLGNGYLTLLGGVISGQEDAGIQQWTSGGGFFEPVAQLMVDGAEIIGGARGLDFSGYDGGTDMTVRNSTIRDQTEASVYIFSGYESVVDLGIVGWPGNNALSVVSGFAIDDHRNDSLIGYEWVYAHGTTLNALGYDGNSIRGPAMIAPDFRIADFDSGIMF